MGIRSSFQVVEEVTIVTGVSNVDIGLTLDKGYSPHSLCVRIAPIKYGRRKVAATSEEKRRNQLRLYSQFAFITTPDPVILCVTVGLPL